MTKQQKELSEQTKRILASADLSLAEYYILITAWLEYPTYQDQLPSFALQLTSGDPRGEYSLSEYAQAFNNCLAKQLLTITTQSDLDYHNTQRKTLLGLSLDSCDLFLGAVDFTHESYAIYRKIVTNIHGREYVDHLDSGWVVNNFQNFVQVLASTEQMATHRLHELTDNFQFYVENNATIIYISPLERISMWRPNRFLTITDGFGYKVSYQK